MTCQRFAVGVPDEKTRAVLLAWISILHTHRALFSFSSSLICSSLPSCPPSSPRRKTDLFPSPLDPPSPPPGFARVSILAPSPPPNIPIHASAVSISFFFGNKSPPHFTFFFFHLSTLQGNNQQRLPAFSHSPQPPLVLPDRTVAVSKVNRSLRFWIYLYDSPLTRTLSVCVHNSPSYDKHRAQEFGGCK